MRIVMSSGHGLKVRGAEGIIDEVDEARKVVEEMATRLRDVGHSVVTFHDDTSSTQNENLDTIVNFHNSQDRDLDVSVHFNAFEETIEPMGTEVLYLTQDELAKRVVNAISKAGDLINRGAKYRADLAFLNGCDEPAILLEICFVDSEADVTMYRGNFELICYSVAMISLHTNKAEIFSVQGACSWFGGPDDEGVAPDEGLAFFYEVEDAPHLFLPDQPEGTTGLARRLDPLQHYVACRWDYDLTPKEMLADPHLLALVRDPLSGEEVLAWPADWGPHEDTDRVADVSPAVMEELSLETDDEVQVIYPARRTK